SRRRHTRSKRDWSSDVCSSDLGAFLFQKRNQAEVQVVLVKGQMPQYLPFPVLYENPVSLKCFWINGSSFFQFSRCPESFARAFCADPRPELINRPSLRIDHLRLCRFSQRRQRINELPGEKMKELCLHLKAMVALQGILFPERPLSSLHLFQQLFRSMTEAYK